MGVMTVLVATVIDGLACSADGLVSLDPNGVVRLDRETTCAGQLLDK
jgi:hypothetical protein